MHLRSAALAIALCLIGNNASADNCLKASPQLKKAALSGHIDDGARDIKFEWLSYTNEWWGGLWAITHSVCNIGGSSVVVSWPNASIFNSSYGPLPKGKSIINNFTVFTEPNAQEAPISYGLNKTPVKASIYNIALAQASLPALRSEVFASLNLTRDSDSTTEIGLIFDVTGDRESYSLSVLIKSEAAGSLPLAISSSQNEVLQAAFSRIGSMHQVSSFEKFITTEASPEYAELLNRKYVILNPISSWKERQVRIPRPLILTGSRSIEVAKLAILNKDYQPLLFANLSLPSQ